MINYFPKYTVRKEKTMLNIAYNNKLYIYLCTSTCGVIWNPQSEGSTAIGFSDFQGQESTITTYLQLMSFCRGLQM